MMAPSTARWLTSGMLPPISVELRTAAETTSFTTGLPTLATLPVLSTTPMTASRTKPVASPVISSVARIAPLTASTAALLAPRRVR